MALLEVEGLTVRLGGHLAVHDASLTVEAGGITGLIGPNGAGKTSLFDAVCGLRPAVAGHIRLGGEELGRLPAHARARKGMARTFQRLETFTHLTVRENIRAGSEFRHDRNGDGGPAAVDRLIDRLGLADVADQRVDRLPTGRARLVEVGRALASRPRLLLLDEPSSGLDHVETRALAGLLRELTADGLGILMVEHDMSLVMGTCDVIHVLELGTVIASGSPAQTQADPVVRTAYLGRAPGEAAEAGSAAGASVSPPVRGGGRIGPAARSGEDAPVPMLRVSGVSAGYGGIDAITDVTFAVGDGEVFGLLGPNGAGKTTTLNVVAGLLRPRRGEVAFCGQSVGGTDADALARAGVRMVPEGRGVFPNLSVAENLWMSSYTGIARGTIEERAYARFPRLAQRSRQMAGTLSGGEQQMLAMARALATDPAMLVLDELSMGLAPMVVAELYACVAELAASGVTVLVVEQFAHELIGVADRLAIMLSGRIVRVGEPEEIAAELERAYLSGVASR